MRLPFFGAPLRETRGAEGKQGTRELGGVFNMQCPLCLGATLTTKRARDKAPYDRDANHHGIIWRLVPCDACGHAFTIHVKVLNEAMYIDVYEIKD